MVLSWLLVHGLTDGLYRAYAVQGTPPVTASAVGDAGRSQLGPWGYFWSERAFHYRTTLMFAVDDGPSPDVLPRDRFQQWPDGVNAWREYTLFMEPVYGWLYRVFGAEREILAEFLTRLIPLVHVLLLPLIYLLARALGARPLLAAGAGLVVASCTLGFARLAGSLLLKEHFTLFWLLGFAAAHAWAQRRRSLRLLTLAAGCLLVVLASWHLGGFLALALLGAAAVVQVAESGRPARGTDSWRLRVPLAYLVASVLAGLTPSLLERGFLLSLPVALLVAWTGVELLRWRRPRLVPRPASALAWLLGLGAVLGAASLLGRPDGGDYDHVSGLLLARLVHGFQRPEDPAALPFAVRVFWASPFTSPAWADVWRELGWHVVSLGGALAAGMLLLVRGRLVPAVRELVLVVLAFTAAWLLFDRLGLVVLPFAAVLLAVVAERVAVRLDARRWRVAAAIAGALMLATPTLNLATGMSHHLRRAADALAGRPAFAAASDDARNWLRGDLLRWLLTDTPGPGSRSGRTEPRAVVAGIGASPAILLYTGRPVVLNSQFENRPIRERYRRYLAALYGDDPALLARFLAETRAGYLVIDRTAVLGAGPGTLAYQAGVRGPLPLASTIARLHFAPQELDFVQPVWENEYYRVFAVMPAPAGAVTWDRRYANWWNLDAFTVRDGRLVDPAGDRARLVEFEKRLAALQEAQAAILQRFAARARGATPLRTLHQQFIELQTRRLVAAASGQDADPQLEQQRTRIIQTIGSWLEARDPASGQTLRDALATLYFTGPPGGGPGWRALVGNPLAGPTHWAAAADLLSLIGQYRQAADLMDRAAAAFPLVPTLQGDGRPRSVAPPLAQQVWRTAVWFHLAAGRAEPAGRKAATFLPLTAPDSPESAFYRRVADLAPR